MRVYIVLILVHWRAKFFKKKRLHYGPKGKQQDTTNQFQCVAYYHERCKSPFQGCYGIVLCSFRFPFSFF